MRHEEARRTSITKAGVCLTRIVRRKTGHLQIQINQFYNELIRFFNMAAAQENCRQCACHAQEEVGAALG
jgi:hypothetical protein